VKIENKDFGIQIQDGPYTMVFGNKSLSREKLGAYFKGVNFHFLEQIHSGVCVEARIGAESKADAHYTYDKNHAVVVKTADFVPLLIYCPITDTCLAIHAGWRGLETEIIPNSIRKAFAHSKPQNLRVFVGPHIAVENYEFSEKDILSLKKKWKFDFYLQQESHYYLNLHSIYMHQLLSLGIVKDRIWLAERDTFTSDDLYSYRRGREKGQNLLHFIFRS